MLYISDPMQHYTTVGAACDDGVCFDALLSIILQFWGHLLWLCLHSLGAAAQDAPGIVPVHACPHPAAAGRTWGWSSPAHEPCWCRMLQPWLPVTAPLALI